MHALVTFIAQYFIVISGVGVLAALWLSKGAERKRLFITLIIGGIFALLLAKLATSVYHDPRPFIRDGVTPYFKSSTDNGFPSDHALASAFAAFAVLGYSRKLALMLGVVAVLIGATRVIAGVHHTQDIIGGFCIAAIGYGIGVGLTRLLLRSKKQQP